MASTSDSSARRRLFDAWSAVYDAPAVQAAVYRPVHDAVVDELWDAHPDVVLDVGCGTGLLTARLAGTVGAGLVVGCDLSGEMLRQAADRSRTVRWVQGDAMQVPVATASVDAVVSTEAFHWIPDQAAALADLHRVLRPGGRIAIGMVTFRTRVAGRLAAAGARGLGQEPHWPTRPELTRLLEGAGFTGVRFRRVDRVASAVVPTSVAVATRP